MEDPGFESRNLQEIFIILQIVQAGPGAHTSSYFVGTGDVSSGESGGGVYLTPHLHLVSRLEWAVLLYLYRP